MSHYPVLLSEVLEVLEPRAGEVYVDGTFGAGGYSAAILERADCKVIAIDRDPEAFERSKAMSAKYKGRFIFMQGRFGDVEDLLLQTPFAKVDGFILDLGVSSFQFDEAQRGFSFRFDGPLDMRMDSSQGLSAADIVNTWDEEDLANAIYRYGEERKSRWIAKKIVARRKEKNFETTQDLAQLVRSVVKKSKDGIDPATRTFQALRIAVNDELGELERGLKAASKILKPGGRLIVVSFHSLEDRMVKIYLREHSAAKENPSRYALQVDNKKDIKIFILKTKKSIKPSARELGENPRSRSARLRYAIRAEVDA